MPCDITFFVRLPLWAVTELICFTRANVNSNARVRVEGLSTWMAELPVCRVAPRVPPARMQSAETTANPWKVRRVRTAGVSQEFFKAGCDVSNGLDCATEAGVSGPRPCAIRCGAEADEDNLRDGEQQAEVRANENNMGDGWEKSLVRAEGARV